MRKDKAEEPKATMINIGKIALKVEGTGVPGETDSAGPGSKRRYIMLGIIFKQRVKRNGR